MSNVVVFMTDEHNPFFSSLYGHPHADTPNMERMAKEGTFFQTAYCPSPLCSPSRSAFASGRYAHEVQVYSNAGLNLQSYPTFGEELAKARVHTVFIGKTHMYAPPENLGFSEMLHPRDNEKPGTIGYTRQPLSTLPYAHERADRTGLKEGAFDDDNLMIDTAVNWLKEKGAGLDCPFVLVVNVLSPHFPTYATQEYWDRYKDVVDLPAIGSDCPTAQHPHARDQRDYFESDLFTREETLNIRRGYLACIAYIDDQIGRIMDILKATGLDKTTDFIYTSDHGDMMGKFGMWWKCTLYEDSARIPCLAVGPDFKAGAVVKTPVDLLDVQASLFSLTGVPKTPGRRGTPLEQVPPDDMGKVVFSEYHGHGSRTGSYMIRKGDYKLIYYVGVPNQLFNIKEDPDETRDLIEQDPEKARELIAELYKICNPELVDKQAHDFYAKQLESLKLEFPDHTHGDETRPKQQ